MNRYILSKKKSIIYDNKYDNEYDNEYDNKIDEFCNKYNVNSNELDNHKIGYRYFCYKYIDYISSYYIPDIILHNTLEAVLIEYRCFQHLEFIIRNAIIKLGIEWSFTVVCGNLNYEFILDMCSKIHQNIKVIKTPYDNLNQSTYSTFMASLDFWNMFSGEKILIYQEDSCIFKSNIKDFLEWDYIGAPWPKNQNDNPNCVGNGGFSLRTKKCMIDVINKISIKDTQYNSSTLKYMNNTGMEIGPEDVYFSLNMIRYNIGKVADWDTAFKFSSESYNNNDSLGGHNFWLSDKDWKNRLYNNNIIQFKQKYNLKLSEHRGGWKRIIESLISSNFYNKNSDIEFYDMIETYYLFYNKYYSSNKWAGIIHCTQSTPQYLNIINIRNLFKNINFIKSLDKCMYIISLSEYVSNYLRNEFNKIGKNIKVFTFKHPVESKDIIMFDYDNYINNNDKSIIQVGQQLRKMSSIYLLNLPNYKKLWLSGTKNIDKCKSLLNQEIKYLNLNQNIINMSSIEIKYTDTFEEYDILLSKNIVFVDLFDASANNTVLECIVRNTPIIINKLPAVIEYLGDNYPLYFNNLEEVPKLINSSLILEAHIYLKNMNKEDLTIDYFKSKIFSCVKL